VIRGGDQADKLDGKGGADRIDGLGGPHTIYARDRGPRQD